MFRDVDAAGDWLLREPDPTSRSLLFVLPYLGSGAQTYRKWPRRIGDCEVCPIQLPGRESRAGEECGSIVRMADSLARALSGYRALPVGIFGHYATALLGYEVVVRLGGGSGATPRLIVSSQGPPDDVPAARFRRMPEERMAEEACTLLLEMGGNPLPSLVEVYLRLLRADLAALDSYRASEPLPGRTSVTAIGWDADFDVAPKSMAGWDRFGTTSSHVLRGDHYSFLSAPAGLMEVIGKAMSGGSSGRPRGKEGE